MVERRDRRVLSRERFDRSTGGGELGRRVSSSLLSLAIVMAGTALGLTLPESGGSEGARTETIDVTEPAGAETAASVPTSIEEERPAPSVDEEVDPTETTELEAESDTNDEDPASDEEALQSEVENCAGDEIDLPEFGERSGGFALLPQVDGELPQTVDAILVVLHDESSNQDEVREDLEWCSAISEPVVLVFPEGRRAERAEDGELGWDTGFSDVKAEDQVGFLANVAWHMNSAEEYPAARRVAITARRGAAAMVLKIVCDEESGRYFSDFVAVDPTAQAGRELDPGQDWLSECKDLSSMGGGVFVSSGLDLSPNLRITPPIPPEGTGGLSWPALVAKELGSDDFSSPPEPPKQPEPEPTTTTSSTPTTLDTSSSEPEGESPGEDPDPNDNEGSDPEESQTDS